MKRTLLIAVGLFISASSAWAGPPRVATDVAPVQSLAAMVMGDIGAVDTILPPGASPHDHALRPSEAAALAQADVIFWIGPELTPWLDHAISTLASDARVVALLDHPDTTRLPLRAGPIFSERGEENSDIEQADPHAWLDPDNAIAWLHLIATELTMTDRDNAETYARNASQAEAVISQLVTDIRRQLSDIPPPRLLTYHDSYQYLEHALRTPALGAILSGDAERPSPGRMLELSRMVAMTQVDCLLAEPGTDTSLARALFAQEGPRIVFADPLGAALAPGPNLYPNLLQALANALLSCDQ